MKNEKYKIHLVRLNANLYFSFYDFSFFFIYLGSIL